MEFTVIIRKLIYSQSNLMYIIFPEDYKESDYKVGIRINENYRVYYDNSFFVFLSLLGSIIEMRKYSVLNTL